MRKDEAETKPTKEPRSIKPARETEKATPESAKNSKRTVPHESGTCQPADGDAAGPDAGPRSGQTDHKQAITISPERMKVVELATQLASAQIMASTYHNSGKATVITVQKLFLDYLLATNLEPDFKSYHNDPSPIQFSEVFSSYYHLESSIKELLHERPTSLMPLNDPKLDDLFKSAMVRAQKLLISPREDRTVIYAEQIFDPEEVISENEIGERFKSCGWPKLRNRQSWYDAAVKIESWYSDHADDMFCGFDNQLLEDCKVLKNFEELCYRRKDNEEFAKLYKYLSTFLCYLRQKLERGSDADEMSFKSWQSHMIDIIFVGRTPKPRTIRDNLVRQYRPWALFRYLRYFAGKDDDETGMDLNELLKTERMHLNGESEFNSLLRSDSLQSFGPLSKLVDQAEENDYFRYQSDQANSSAT